tara:strand:+ start:282 stop:1223 length:942 start_codon:yes stop_codon:yes gene_type:complete
VLLIGGSVFVPLILLYYVTGALYPAPEVEVFGSVPLELTGIFLLASIMPSYLLMCLVAGIRVNNNTHAVIATLVEAPQEAQLLRYRWARLWPLSVFPAMVFALTSNIEWQILSFDSASNRFVISLTWVFSQFFLWSIVGLVLFFSIHESLVLNNLAKKVRVDLYQLDSLNGFGSAGLNSFLMLAGALALTALQSIGQGFRFDNYVNALIVVIPAALILVPLPIWRIHRCMLAEKKSLLQGIAIEIQGASSALEDVALHRMNALLQRKEQIHRLRSWPMDLSIFSRFVLYVFIPPLAWVGAALMEVFLDSMLIG